MVWAGARGQPEWGGAPYPLGDNHQGNFSGGAARASAWPVFWSARRSARSGKEERRRWMGNNTRRRRTLEI